jgi:hypothetical protein
MIFKFGFTAGVNYTITSGRFIDYKYYLDGVIAQFPYYVTQSITTEVFSDSNLKAETPSA